MELTRAVQGVTGDERLGTGQLVTVIGYPGKQDSAIFCVRYSSLFSATQLVFRCGGYTTGTSGGGPARRPVSRILSPSQHGDCPRCIPLLQAIRISRRGLGRSRTRTGAALADRAYSSAANRAYLRKRGSRRSSQ